MRRGLTRSGAGLAVGLATLLSVTACGPGDLPRDSTGPAALPAAPVAQPVAAPSVALNGKPPSPTTVDSVALGKPVAFSIADGTLAKVSVQDDDGVALAGTVGSGGRSWVNTDPVLPSSTYTATLYVADRTGTFSQHVVHFSTPHRRCCSMASFCPTGRPSGWARRSWFHSTSPYRTRPPCNAGCR